MIQELIHSSTITIEPFAFKEWSLICDALMEGRQSIILRKGGIVEKRRGFEFEHSSFYLLPTHYHAQREETLFEADQPIHWQKEGSIFLPAVAILSFAANITDFSKVEALSKFHFWKEDTLRARFQYGQANSLHLAFVRVYKIEPVIELQDGPEFRGCKSWIALSLDKIKQQPFTLKAVLSDEEHQKQLDEIQKLIT